MFVFDDVYVFDCCCGVWCFWLFVLGNEICEIGSRGCIRGSGNSIGICVGRVVVCFNEYFYCEFEVYGEWIGLGIVSGFVYLCGRIKIVGGVGKIFVGIL